jgi:hypothetical protein
MGVNLKKKKVQNIYGGIAFSYTPKNMFQVDDVTHTETGEVGTDFQCLLQKKSREVYLFLSWVV